MFRCYHCSAGFDSTLAAPPCPVCEAEGEPVVVRVEVTHFDPPTKTPGRGKNCAACNPALKVGLCADYFTGEKSAVTCKACKETEVFRTAGPPGAVPLRFKKV